MSTAQKPPQGMPKWLFDRCIETAKGRPIFAWFGLRQWTFGVSWWAKGIWLHFGPLGVRVKKIQAAERQGEGG